MEPGTVVCLKTTGELVVVLRKAQAEGGMLSVRRPVMTHEDGILQLVDSFYDFELETIETHLRREALEMVLKVKIQEEMQEEMEKNKKDKKIQDFLVN